MSSCCGELAAFVADFCVEPDEEFSGQCDANDHFGFAGGEELVAECGETGVEPSRDVGDEEKDGSDRGAPAACASLTGSCAAVVGDRGKACQLDNGLVG